VISGHPVPVYSIKEYISLIFHSYECFQSILQTSSYDGENFGNVTTGRYFHHHFGDCANLNIIPLQGIEKLF